MGVVKLVVEAQHLQHGDRVRAWRETVTVDRVVTSAKAWVGDKRRRVVVVFVENHPSSCWSANAKLTVTRIVNVVQ